MAKYILDFTEKYNMSFPGWESECMAKLDELSIDRFLKMVDDPYNCLTPRTGRQWQARKK